MITSVSNPQMKRIKELLNKSKQRRKEKCFVAEGIRMVAETPVDRLERVYVSESFYRHPPELRGLDLSKALIVMIRYSDRFPIHRHLRELWRLSDSKRAVWTLL